MVCYVQYVARRIDRRAEADAPFGAFDFNKLETNHEADP